jgi:hypothetical protein
MNGRRDVWGGGGGGEAGRKGKVNLISKEKSSFSSKEMEIFCGYLLTNPSRISNVSFLLLNVKKQADLFKAKFNCLI